MKIAILGDTHFGTRGDSTRFHEFQKDFYEQTFFPYCEQHGIDTVIQEGDLFDRRKFINYNTLHLARAYFFDVLAVRGMKMITFPGNHDIFWRESLEVNSQALLLKDYANITSLSTPQVVELGGCKFAMVPWICDSNREEALRFLATADADVCIGHFEIEGFSMSAGSAPGAGLDRKMFERFTHTFSGHYHTHSIQDNIIYTGAPYELTWMDANDKKYFFVYDTETMTYEKVANPFRMFIHTEYKPEAPHASYNNPRYQGRFVKFHIHDAVQDGYHFDRCMSALMNSGPAEVKVIDHAAASASAGEGEDGSAAPASVMDAVQTWLDQTMKDDPAKPQVFDYLKSLYDVALEYQVDREGSW